MMRTILPTKLIEKRGDRTRREIVEAAESKFTEQALYSYEKGLSKPSVKKLPYLLKALGTTYNAVSAPVDLSISE